MAKYGVGFSTEFAWAVKQGIIQEPFCLEDVRRFADMKGWSPSQNYLNVVLPNGSSDSHSPTYKKYFTAVGNGMYRLSEVGKELRLE